MSFFETLAADTKDEQQVLLSVPQLQDGLAGRISRQTYLDYLAEAYHHVKHTVPLMRLAQSRMDANHAPFKAALDDYVAEETGHEAWILSDIANAGGDAQSVRTGAPRAATEMMVAFAYDYVGRVNPMGFFGMVYVLEGTSVALASHGAASVQRSLGLADDCFTYLTSHGALDQSHMVFFRQLMDRVDDPADRQAIVHMARRIFLLFAQMFASIPHERSLAHAV